MLNLRDEYTCRRCGLVTEHGEVDHVVPLHLGGRETDGNRQWLCRQCHGAKSEREEKARGFEKDESRRRQKMHAALVRVASSLNYFYAVRIAKNALEEDK